MTQTIPQLGSSQPIRPASRRRWRVLLVLAVVAAMAATALVVARRLLDDDAHRQYLSTNGWPAVGQGAYQVGDESPRASANERPAPIASLAKVMTALVVVKHRPLGSVSGPVLVVTGRDVADTERRRVRDESVVPLALGERLTERAALMALLLPSANNVAVMLARYVSGSVARFVALMNRTARALGMTETTYTDPSGYEASTVSTARDQLTLAREVAKDETLAAIMATKSYRLPVGGVVHNTDSLLGHGGFVGMKTGSHDAAGGCFMFRAYRSIDGVNVEVLGVVLGQRGRHLITAGLYAAKQLVDRVAPEPAHP